MFSETWAVAVFPLVIGSEGEKPTDDSFLLLLFHQ